MYQQIHEAITSLRQQKPLVLNITNYVTMDFVANGLLSMGASPVMSHALQDIEDLVKLSQTVVINLGTLDDDFIKLCEQACHLANQLNKPIILDPVGAGAGPYRTETAKRLLKQFKIAIVRGNASEIMALTDTPVVTKGVDSLAQSEQAIQSAKQLAIQFHVTVLISGEQDIIVDEHQQQTYTRGSALMPMITGSGCLLSSVVGAFHAIEANPFAAAAMAAVYYGVCGEMAAVQAQGPGSFKLHFLDALSLPWQHKYYEPA